jgi:hypothetical protein
MISDKFLATAFGNDSGEDEVPELLNSYFVEIPQFERFFSADDPLVIVRARKGMGKSALLANLHYKLTGVDARHIVIRTTGNELFGLGEFSMKGQARLENHWKQVLCKRICLEIGKTIGFAMSGDSLTMVEASELEGFRNENIVSALSTRLGPIVEKQWVMKKGVPNPLEALRRYQKDNRALVWVLIDDIDAKFANTTEEQERIGAFFSALRSLAFSVKNIRIRASVRTDVWYALRGVEDQDKQRQYIIDIGWTDETLRSVFAKKILVALNRHGRSTEYRKWSTKDHYHEIVHSIFAKAIDPFHNVKIYAGSRPRWIGQLCRLAGKHANGDRITSDNVKEAMPSFGREKLDDFRKEHEHQFADIRRLVMVFRNGQSRYRLNPLRELLREKYVDRVTGSVPKVNGVPFKHVDQLGAFLYETEFLIGSRISAPRGSYLGLVSYQDDRELFDSPENGEGLITWLVNISYAKFLRLSRTDEFFKVSSED